MTDTATGCVARHVPPGDDRDRLLGLVRLGVRFQAQHCGRRPGFLRNYINDLVANMPPPITFANLLAELDLATSHRSAGDGRGEPIERLSRTWEQLTYHDPKHGRQQIGFVALRKYLTKAKNARSP